MANSSASQVVRHLREAVLLREAAGRSDGQLLEDYLGRRDEAAVAALVQRHAPMVWGVCRRLLSHHDAEDAFQATFLVLVRKAASVVPQDMVANWLYGVAHQTALKARATAATRQARERQVDPMPEPIPEPNCEIDLQPLFDEELSRLPDIYRIALVLCELEGKTRKEAAGQLGVPEGTLAARVARGRAMLARRLAARGVVPAALVASTINAATLLAAGKAATAVVSAKVAALTEGVLKGMLMSKLKIATGVFVLAGLLITGGMVAVRARQPVPPAAALPSPEPPDDTPPWKKEFRKAYGLRRRGGAARAAAVPGVPDGVLPVRAGLRGPRQTPTRIHDLPVRPEGGRSRVPGRWTATD
jgi:RNA polymerase sigma factor (sigma-70 family)